ncbi:MAG: hypothetical protein HFJ40_04660 [Clostridia bacterium]|nr:hypothetical protein [Clostridia bacterium]
MNKILKELKIKKTIYSKEEKDFFIIATKVIIKNQFKKDLSKKILRNIEMEEERPMMQVIETLNKEREKLREDSIKRGKIEGKVEGKIEDIKNMLKEKLPIELISRITGMTEKEIKSIK